MASPLKSIALNRSSYDLSDLISYGLCPVKMPKYVPASIESQEHLWSVLVSKSFSWIASKALSGSFPSMVKFDTQFNLIWDDLKPSIMLPISTDLLLVTKAKCSRVYKFFSSLKSFEIIACNQEFEYLESTCPIKLCLTIFRHQNIIYSIYLDTTVAYGKDLSMYPIAYSVVDSFTRSFLKGFSYVKKPYIVRSQNFSFHTYNPISNLPNVINNITIGLDYVKYPVVDLNCKICTNKSICKWNNE